MNTKTTPAKPDTEDGNLLSAIIEGFRHQAAQSSEKDVEMAYHLWEAKMLPDTIRKPVFAHLALRHQMPPGDVEAEFQAFGEALAEARAKAEAEKETQQSA